MHFSFAYLSFHPLFFSSRALDSITCIPAIAEIFPRAQTNQRLASGSVRLAPRTLTRLLDWRSCLRQLWSEHAFNDPLSSAVVVKLCQSVDKMRQSTATEPASS